MPLLDLSQVTEAVSLMISSGIAGSSAWAPNPSPAVEATSPEAMTAEGLCLYLYGVGENPVAANQPGPRANTPLGLDLHYQLTAHSSANPPTTVGARREQLLLGLAMKVLHEHGRLESGVTVNGADIFADIGIPADNSMSITLRTLEPEQAINWWTASPAGIRASAYYTVSVALIQEAPDAIAGPPVLVREVFGFAGLAPHIISTQARHAITPPGRPTTSLTSQPATVEPGRNFEIVSTGADPHTSVRVRGEAWLQAETLPGASLRTVDGVQRMLVTLDATVAGRAVVPGVIRVSLVRHELRLLADGSTREFEHESNETAVSVVPAVTAVLPPAGAGQPFTIQGGPFEATGIDPAGVRLIIDADELEALPAGPPSAGQFRITTPGSIEFVPPLPQASATAVRVRVLVNGAENLPFWYVAP